MPSGNIKEAFEYAAKNPASDFAKNLGELAKSGSLNLEASKYGIDLSGFQPAPEPAKKNVAESIASFTGGEKIAQGVGQALNQKNAEKSVSDVQEQQVDIQGKLLQRIKEVKAAGQDTSHLESALATLNNDIFNTGNNAEKVLNPNGLTGKQVIGDALQLATTAGGAKVAGAVTGAATEATGVGAGILQGAKTGAIAGVPLGALTGVSQGLKNDESGGQIATDAVKGAVSGALTGGALGAVTGGIAGKVNSVKAKNANFAQELVAPKETAGVKEQALKEGRVTDPGIFSKSKIIPGERDKNLAEAVSSYVSPKKTITENIDSVSSGVRDINNGVKAYVKENKVPFNTNQLKTQLNKGKDELNLIFASDSNAEKTYNSVVNEFLKHVKSKDTAGLLDARQEFDKIPAIKKLLDSQGLGENAKKEIVLTARSQANKYIANLLPKGNSYRAQLLQESKMIEAIGNMAEKSTGMIGQTKLNMLIKEYPVLKWITGLAVGTGIGAGGAILNSTD